MKVIAVMHTTCIYESAYYVVSLHTTKEGAVAAMRDFKVKRAVWADSLAVSSGYSNHDRYPLLWGEGFRYLKLEVKD